MGGEIVNWGMHKQSHLTSFGVGFLHFRPLELKKPYFSEKTESILLLRRRDWLRPSLCPEMGECTKKASSLRSLVDKTVRFVPL